MAGASFGYVDYVVLGSSLFLSVVIGGIATWYRCTRPTNTSTDYLLGCRRLPVVPASLSLASSGASTLILVGVPAEIYRNGVQFSLFLVALLSASALVAAGFLPTLIPLRLTSVLEYVEVRFASRLLRAYSSLVQIILQLLTISCMVYCTCVALEGVVGFKSWISVLILLTVSTSYSLPSGLPSVLWTNTYHFFTIIAFLVVSVAVAFSKLDHNPNSLWRQLKKYGYNDFFVLDPSPIERMSVWSITLVFFVYWVAYFITAPAYQHAASLTSLAKSKICLVVAGFLQCIIGAGSALLGMLTFAVFTYIGCEPMNANILSHGEQILPHFVFRVIHSPGVAGLFIAALCSSVFCCVSVAQVSVACCVWEDILKWKFYNVSETTKAILLKMLVLHAALVTIAIVVPLTILDQPRDVFELYLSYSGCLLGPLLGTIILGGAFPFAGALACGIGATAGLVLTLWLCVGRTIYDPLRPWVPDLSPPAPVNCTTLWPANTSLMVTGVQQRSVDLSTTLVTPIVSTSPSPSIPWQYEITFLSYTVIGTFVTVIIGVIISLFPCTRQKYVDPDCLFPCVRWMRDKFLARGHCNALCVDDGEEEVFSNLNSSGMFHDTSHIIHKRITLANDKSPLMSTHQKLITVQSETVL